MIIFILSALTGIVTGIWVYFSYGGWLWPILWGFVSAFAMLMGLNLIFVLKLRKLMNAVQQRMKEFQDQIQNLIHRQSTTGKLSPAFVERRSEELKNQYFNEVLDLLKQAEPWFKWSVFIERQIEMNRFVLYYQLRKYTETDVILPRLMILDPTIAAMKLARLYQRGEYQACDEFYKKIIKRFPKDKGTLLYATYSWILLKQDRKDEAVEVLAKGKDVTKNEGLAKNWEAVANNRLKQFSNHFLGENWYGLLLEKPVPQKMKMSREVQKNHPLYGGKIVNR